MFESIFSNLEGESISINLAFVSIFASIILGIIIAVIYKNTGKYTKNFLVTLTILPLLVQAVIMMVNGNLGTSVAVLGAFSLVRFRSIPGSSREIISIFFAMAVGLALGMGQILFAGIITAVVGILLFAMYKTKLFGENKSEQQLKITLPEDLDYVDIFEDTFKKYLSKWELEKTKTTNMGSLYDLTYKVVLKDAKASKKFIDELRVKNGNLDISLGSKLNEELL